MKKIRSLFDLEKSGPPPQCGIFDGSGFFTLVAFQRKVKNEDLILR